MNMLSSLLLVGLSALPVTATLEEEVVVLTAEDLERKRCPVFFAVHRAGDTGISIDFMLPTSSSVAPEAGPYQLEVLKQPLAAEQLPRQLIRPELIARTEVVRQDRATFDLKKDEIPNSALMIYLADKTQAGVRKIRGFCLPLAELMKSLPRDRRNLLAGSDQPPTA